MGVPASHAPRKFQYFAIRARHVPARPYGTDTWGMMNANENGKYRYININSIHDNRNMNKMMSSVFQVQ